MFSTYVVRPHLMLANRRNIQHRPALLWRFRDSIAGYKLQTYLLTYFEASLIGNWTSFSIDLFSNIRLLHSSPSWAVNELTSSIMDFWTVDHLSNLPLPFRLSHRFQNILSGDRRLWWEQLEGCYAAVTYYILSFTISKLLGINGQICAFDRGVPLFITLVRGESLNSAPRNLAQETRNIALSCSVVQNTFRYLECLSVVRGSRVWQTDGQTDSTVVCEPNAIQAPVISDDIRIRCLTTISCWVQKLTRENKSQLRMYNIVRYIDVVS